jgi:high-affinity iron transporter
LWLQAFAITFTDSLEAFLVIAATVAFLRKTRQPGLASAVGWGITVSLVTSPVGAWLYSRTDHQALWEGRLALTAAIVIAGLAAFMWCTRGRLTDPEMRGSSATSGGFVGLVFSLATALVVSREGMHTVLLISTFVFQIRLPSLTLGVVSGLVLAGLIAWLWARYGHRLRLSVFVPVTVIVLALVMTQLVSDVFQNLGNASAPPAVMELESPTGR